MPKSRFSGRVLNLSATHSNGFGAPGAHGGPKGALGAPKGPLGASAMSVVSVGSASQEDQEAQPKLRMQHSVRSQGQGATYSTGTVTRSEHKVSKPSKGETGGIGIRTPRVGGQGKMGGITRKIGEIGKNTKGGGNRGMAL